MQGVVGSCGAAGDGVAQEARARSSTTLGMTEGRDAEDQLLRPDHRS
jgi:hypothetical protein